MESNFTIQPEQPNHQAGIDEIIRLGFGSDEERKKRTVYQFRHQISSLTSLNFVAIDKQGELLGSIRFWPVLAPNATILPLLGPLAVIPELRGRGIGHALVKKGIQACSQHYPAILIVGEPGYYVPMGFCVNCVKGLSLPGTVSPLILMGYEITPNSLSSLNGMVKPNITD